MKYKLGVGAVMGLVLASGAHAHLLRTLNTDAIYGQIVANSSTLSGAYGTTSERLSGIHTIGGIGAEVSGINKSLLFIRFGLNFGFGPLAKEGTATGVVNASASAPVSGHSRAFNFRLGKGFLVGQDVLIGPYLAYQYAQFSDALGDASLTYTNNAVGGGFYGAIAASKTITVSAHAGYLVSFSPTASLSGTDIPDMPGADVLQVGGKLDYRMTHSSSLFMGIDYDGYRGSYTYVTGTPTLSVNVDEIRGILGIAYHY